MTKLVHIDLRLRENKTCIIPKFGIIFLSICSANGKIYIGKTVQSTRFLNGNYIGTGGKRYRNDKIMYGVNAFTVYILEQITGTINDLNIAEIKWIAFYRSHFSSEQLYNETVGGDGISSEDMYRLYERDPDYRHRIGSSVRACWIGAALRREKMASLAVERNTRSYRIRSPSGEIFEFRNLLEFCSTHQLNYFSMRHVCQGRIFFKRGPYVGWISLDHHQDLEKI